MNRKGSPGTVVKLLPCGNGHGFKSWKQPLAEMQGKVAYIRPKVVGPYASGNYMHQAALYGEMNGNKKHLTHL
jgi:hypothetical protein